MEKNNECLVVDKEVRQELFELLHNEPIQNLVYRYDKHADYEEAVNTHFNIGTRANVWLSSNHKDEMLVHLNLDGEPYDGFVPKNKLLEIFTDIQNRAKVKYEAENKNFFTRLVATIKLVINFPSDIR